MQRVKAVLTIRWFFFQYNLCLFFIYLWVSYSEYFLARCPFLPRHVGSNFVFLLSN